MQLKRAGYLHSVFFTYPAALCGHLHLHANTHRLPVATGTAEVGGWSTRELLAILEGLEGISIVGADVVEVAPIYDNPGETTILAAAQVALTLMSLMVQTPVEV